MLFPSDSQLVRDAGALRSAGLSQLGLARAWMGDLAAATSVVAESDSVTAAAGSQVKTRACRSPERCGHWPRPRPNTKVQ
jgi:hypothetical protein